METVYLVGQISPKFEITYAWRQNVIERFDPFVRKGDVKFINPCANKFNQDVLKRKVYAVHARGRQAGIDLLVPKDRAFVDRSSIGLVNMNQYDSNKPLLGSFFELAWYFDSPQKAVIGFADNLNHYLCQHPFVQQAVNVWVNDEMEACDLIEKYFV
jgi:hypothetical protein